LIEIPRSEGGGMPGSNIAKVYEILDDALSEAVSSGLLIKHGVEKYTSMPLPEGLLVRFGDSPLYLFKIGEITGVALTHKKGGDNATDRAGEPDEHGGGGDDGGGAAGHKGGGKRKSKGVALTHKKGGDNATDRAGEPDEHGGGGDDGGGAAGHKGGGKRKSKAEAEPAHAPEQ